MKKRFLFLIFSITAANSFAQKETFELVKYIAPKGWKKELRQDLVMYTVVDKKDKAWCQLGIYKSTDSKGSLENDFDADWKELVCKTYKITDTVPPADTAEADGWKIKTGSGKFTFNNKPAAAMLTTFSGYGRSISIVAVAGNQRYLQNIQDLIASIELTRPSSGNLVESNQTPTVSQNGFAFSTTNFDDGWVSTIQEDWVLVQKAGTKVLLHYDVRLNDALRSDIINGCFNLLAAPRYTIRQRYHKPYNELSNPYYFIQAEAIDNATGEQVFISFRVITSGGGAFCYEVISPSKEAFQQLFPSMDKIENMRYYNRFAIAAPDLKGKWAEGFSSNTFYTNINTGLSAGMSSYTSSEWFQFDSNQAYKWKLVAAHTYGSTSVGTGEGAGKFDVLNSWQLYFPDIDGKAKTFDAYFSAVKGGRVLWMNDAKYPGSGIFTGYTQK
jgi:hypothetical protein